MIRNRVTRVLLFALLCAPVSGAPLACDYSAKEVAKLGTSELLEFYEEFECWGLRDAVSRELRERIGQAETLADADADADEILQLRFMLELDQLRRAVQAVDRGAIDAAVLEIDRLSNLQRERGVADDVDAIEDVDEELVEFGVRVADIREIVNGMTRPPLPKRFEAKPDWTLHFGSCGTPAMGFYMANMLLPGAEDAWSAVGRDDVAVSHLLESQWVDAMSLGMSPPRLREFAVRMLGEQGYKREIEIALQGISIDDVGGIRTAHMPLLGHWLPLPLAIASENKPEPKPFATAESLAEWLSQKLLATVDEE